MRTLNSTIRLAVRLLRKGEGQPVFQRVVIDFIKTGIIRTFSGTSSEWRAVCSTMESFPDKNVFITAVFRISSASED